MLAKIIYNPYSARWKALERRPEVEAALKEAGLAYDLTLTEAPGHAITLAAEAARSGYAAVVAAGGDGTINEVVNGLMQVVDAGEEVPPFGFLPIGTANDFAANLELPIELPAMIRRILAGETRQVDLCQVNDRYFANNAGIGLEPYISVLQMQMTRLRGVVRYLAATLKGIAHNPQWQMSLEWDGGSYEGPVTLVSIGNGARTGGIFYTVPHANPFDGKLSFIYGYIPTRGKIMLALPKIMRPHEGNITEHPAIREVHAEWLNVRISPSSPSHADGEVFTTGIRELRFKVHPGKLKLSM